MKNFKHWGIKVRVYPEKNYHAVWCNLKTIRLGSGVAQELEPDHAEFYDVSLGTKCNLECPFCYTDAKRNGVFYTDIVKKAKHFFGNMDENQKPFQIAIGSEGEPTIHPEFLDFIKAIYDMGIVPNYTTNGIVLSHLGESPTSNECMNNILWEKAKQLLDYTEKYCGGVAISANTWNPSINIAWRNAIEVLSTRDININVHYIIKDNASVDEFVQIFEQYKNKVLYFVLLPLMDSGRSSSTCSEEAFKYLLTKDLDLSKIAFGAHFYNALIQNQDKIKCWLYPPESLSKNLILDDTIKITASSFHKDPLMEIPYKVWVDVDDRRYFIYAHEKEMMDLFYRDRIEHSEHLKQYLKVYG